MNSKDLKNDIITRDKSATDISKFKNLYQYDDGEIFEGLGLATLNRFKEALIAQSEYRVLDTKYYYRPDYFCYDTYDMKDVWFLILYVNDIFDRSSFNKEQIYIPSRNAVVNILANNINLKDKLIQITR